ncbi:MAG: hypothetical protein HZA74_12575 [Ignavibacteriales bacterium]|nr:hypothetical protein [Ignavibacteriales bacterium]
MKPALSILLIVVTIVSLSCQHTTEPERKIKHPQEMTWTVDTLPISQDAIQIMVVDLLVVSPTDIWLALWTGHGQMMHYDGKSWKIVKEVSGGINCIVQGKGNDIWIGGYIGHLNVNEFTRHTYIGKYNGTSWIDNQLNINSEVFGMAKDQDGNIWTCGGNGVILKIDNNKFIIDTINVNHYSDAEYYLSSIDFYKNKAWAISSVYDSKRKRDLYHVINGDIKNWTVVDSMIIDGPNSILKWGQWKLFSNRFGKLYSIGLGGIWEYINNGWNQTYESRSNISGIDGLGEDYLIAVGNFKEILFYDGNKWENIANILPEINNNLVFKDVWTNGNEIFIAGHEAFGFSRALIFHGK